MNSKILSHVLIETGSCLLGVFESVHMLPRGEITRGGEITPGGITHGGEITRSLGPYRAGEAD